MNVDLWSLNNKYSYGKNIDNYMQLHVSERKYKQNRGKNKSSISSAKEEKESKKILEQMFQSAFLYSQLDNINYFSKKITGTIIDETEDIQTIKYKSEKREGTVLYYEGLMQYNKKENTIIYLKAVRQQQNMVSKGIDTDGTKMISDTYLYTNIYDMYKKNGKYLPSKITVESFAKLTINNNNSIGKDNFEYVFNNHQFSDSKGFATKSIKKNYFSQFKFFSSFHGRTKIYR